MNARERVFTTLDHREPDRVPWGEHWIDYTVYQDILGRESFVHGKMKETRAWWDGRDREIVAGYKRDVPDLADALGLEIITVELLPVSQYPILGKLGLEGLRKPMKPLAGQSPEENAFQDEKGNIWHVSSATHDLMPYRMNSEGYVPPTLDSLKEEIHRLDSEGVPKPEEWRWELIRHVVKTRKDTHFIACLAPDIGFPGFGLTDDDYYASMALHPEMLAPLAERAGRSAIASLRHYAEEGVDGLIPCADYGHSTGLLASPAIFRNHVFPWLARYCDEAHRLGMKVLKHSCGRSIDIFDLMIQAGYDAYEAIQPTAGMDIRELDESFGDRITLWGGVSNESLIGGTESDIRREADYAIRNVAPGGGYIYGASHSLAVGTRRENLLAMKRCRDELGVYPIRSG